MTDEKRTFILETAAQLFFKHGIKSVTMDEIARHSGISKKTIYFFFKDKEALVDAFTEKHFICNESFPSIDNDEINAIDHFFRLREYVLQFFELTKNNIDYDLKRSYPKIYTKLKEFKRVFIYQTEQTLLKKGQAEGLFRTELDTDFIARLSVGRSLLIFNPDNELFNEKECMSIGVFDRVLDYHLHAICTSKGLEYYKKQLNRIQNEN